MVCDLSSLSDSTMKLTDSVFLRGWPGRAIIHVASTKVAPKYQVPHSLAPVNRKDLFLGTVNYHLYDTILLSVLCAETFSSSRNDSKVKGFMADQTKDLVGKMGDYKVRQCPIAQNCRANATFSSSTTMARTQAGHGPLATTSMFTGRLVRPVSCSCNITSGRLTPPSS